MANTALPIAPDIMEAIVQPPARNGPDLVKQINHVMLTRPVTSVSTTYVEGGYTLFVDRNDPVLEISRL